MPVEVVYGLGRAREAWVDLGSLERAGQAALEHGGRGAAVLSVVLVDDPTLAELHDRCLGDPTPTDVMSFELSEDAAPEGAAAGPERGPDGEVLVSVDRAIAVAAERGCEPARELALYVVHGTLHLCGFDDHSDADRAAMRSAEARVLARLGYAPE